MSLEWQSLILRLEESLPATPGTEQLPVQRVGAQPAVRRDEEEDEERAEAEEELRARLLDEAAIRDFLSAKDLKSVRNNDFNNRKSSSCFGGRMDRIGSMSSMGCNSASRFSKQRRCGCG